MKTVRHTPKHWFNNNIEKAMSGREAANEDCKRNNSSVAVTHQQLLGIYEEKSNGVKSLINSCEKKSTVESFVNAKSIHSKCNFIESLGCCKTSKDNISN